MKTKNLIYLAGAAVIAYFLFKKKKTTTQTTSATVLQEASKAANDVLQIIPDVTEKISVMPDRPVFTPIKPRNTDLLQIEPIQDRPVILPIKNRNTELLPLEPMRVTQSELVDFAQISPTPASILSPDQLIRFETKAAKAQLMGVC